MHPSPSTIIRFRAFYAPYTQPFEAARKRIPASRANTTLTLILGEPRGQGMTSNRESAKSRRPQEGRQVRHGSGHPRDLGRARTHHAALKASPRGQSSEVHVYPEMPRAFHADYRPSYRKDAAEDGWKRMLAWFKRNGVS